MILSALALGGCVEVLNLDRFSIEDDAGRDAATPLRDAATPDGCRPMAFYRDQDGDGAGDPEDAISACSAPAGYVASGDDCDDSSSAIGPSVEELCDGIDQNCDGTVDEGLTPRTTFYRDEDGDGAGDDSDSVEACAAPAGYVATGGDCAPSDGTVFPGADETCDGVDQDCDTGIDEGVFGARGASRVIAPNIRGVSLAFGGGSFWLAWASGTEIHVAETDRNGVTTGADVSWSTTATARFPAIAIADTPAGLRAVVAYREGNQMLARVVDLSDTTVSTPIILGLADGDQFIPKLATMGPRVLAAWFAGQRLRARTVDPVGEATQGVLLDEVVASASSEYFRFPAVQPEGLGSTRLWVALPVRRGSDPGAALYLGWLDVEASPVWGGTASLARTMPYPDVLAAVVGPPREGRLPIIAHGGASGTCMTGADLAGAPSFSASCEPMVGIPASSLVRRGGVLSTLLLQGGRSLALADLADAEGTAGGAFMDISTSPVNGADIALSDDPRFGLVAFEAGASAPYSLTVRPVGCEP